ncbi:hypothetical protein B0H34DRAFT_675209 [Crassisporium funariophilum]|nr:hypothetical protein B0H34DRAFT_675209 [Crassisporium funariophilum]
MHFGLKQKRGIGAILNKIRLVADGVYKHTSGSTTAPAIVPFPGWPRVDEVKRNVEAVLDGIEEIIDKDPNIRHMVLMFDKIATEKRTCWDQSSNKLLGMCLELEFNNEVDIEKMFKMIDKGELHHTAEATVGAMGILCGNHQLYPACPVLVSGDCKRETG